jgi:hypothetical protein
MTTLISFFGWFDIIIATPFVLYFGYKIIKWIISKLKKTTAEGGTTQTPDVES